MIILGNSTDESGDERKDTDTLKKGVKEDSLQFNVSSEASEC